MTSNLKAKELIEKFSKTVPDHFGGMDIEISKQCAIIAVDEILKSMLVKADVKFEDEAYEWYKSTYEMWQEVKQEIEKL